MTISDLTVDSISQALRGRAVDVIVSGSIAAVESVRLVRSLRRLGAEVTPWLTSGGRQFITPTALTWAAARPVVERFSGSASHIALNDMCVIAPASVNMLTSIASGATDSPATALVQSYLGQGKPVLVVANGHDSLTEGPIVKKIVNRLKEKLHFLPARLEEGKHKFPEPAQLADQIAHHINRAATPHWPAILVAMGTTRGYLDDIRFISNYSSGALGTTISEELYRCGIVTHVVCGPCTIQPHSVNRFTCVETNAELRQTVLDELAKGCQGTIFLPSVLDFLPTKRTEGKIPSSQNQSLTTTFERTEKILPLLNVGLPIKVGFKLLTRNHGLDLEKLAREYSRKCQLSALVVNLMENVDRHRHQALLIKFDGNNQIIARQDISGKRQLAQQLVGDVYQTLGDLLPKR